MRPALLVLLPTFVLALLTTGSPLLAQSPPADFRFSAASGGLAPWSEQASIIIDNVGQGVYTRCASGGGFAVLAETTFTVSASDVQQLWKVIQDSSFFTLSPSWSDSATQDGMFALIRVTANGMSHQVSIEKIEQSAIQSILASLDAIVPPNLRLTYSPPQIIDLTPNDPCASPFAPFRTPSDVNSALRNSRDPKLRGFPGPYRQEISSVPPTTPSHPGTVVACSMTLQDAVARGWATTSSKGDYFGDDVSITVDNRSRPPCNDVTITLFLDFYGPLATQENVNAIIQDIKNKWAGATTSSGKQVKIDVVGLAHSGSSTPPRTPGFHQIEIVPRETGGPSHVAGEPVPVNSGIGAGKWEFPGNPGLFAHEAGHLMGLADTYVRYYKKSDGSWVDTETGQSYASDNAFADFLVTKTPGRTAAEIADFLKKTDEYSVPREGSENDLMATLSGQMTQADIDMITANPGLLVTVPSGTVLTNRNGSEQNEVVTHKEDVYAGPGETRTLNGIYAACIDHSKGIPSFSAIFDVAPPLDQWTGIQAAAYLTRLLRFVDSTALYCDANFVTQEAIWRLSDNTPSAFSTRVDTVLLAAGIDLGDQFLDFPRLGGSGLSDSGSHPFVPTQLYVANIRPGFAAGQVGVATEFRSGLSVPSGVPYPISVSWSATGPDSTPAPIAGTDSTASLTPTSPGIYQVALKFTLDDSVHGQKTFHSDRKGYVIVPDEYTETFEHPGLTDKYPWRTNADAPWRITANNPETGTHAAQPAGDESGAYSTLEIEVNLPADSVIVFSIRTFTSGFFDGVTFSIDSVEQDRLGGGSDWKIQKYPIPAGRHLLTWKYLTYSTNPASSAWLDNIFFPGNVVVTSVGDKTPDVPKVFALEQNYPNPFNPKTVVSSQLPAVSDVKMVIYDVLGREVRVLVNERRAAGKYEDVFDASDLASGVYIYRMTAGSFVQTRRMVLVK